ncbi:GNAT family N-acetyltransferase [Castellaniella defragrans]|uniref:CelD/BcsL family acetyltransferase involved in cellulose biosynthesis n=1 Tax=Castellaniella defragrans TaxID=75697 RepID=A0A7W9TNA5_CASDE|nr:GNAT family N-acetyltransferase [Castellaniella defragrans]KAB0609135.1 GNAT family N-acetyltransferase [Castellaniella defragrans]MBB6083296.1 CelD/BcsL family acetyltransferase involved in cellulose biosynthesis [Castellaniella defragrans]
MNPDPSPLRDTASRSLPGLRIALHADLAPLESAWRALLPRCDCSAFQTWAWNRAWQDCIGEAQGVRPRILLLRDADGRVLGLFPLGLYRRGGLRVLAFLGDVVSDYRMPLLARDWIAGVPAGAFAGLWRECLALIAEADVVLLERMPAGFDGRPNPMAALAGAEHVENAWLARLPASAEAYRAQRSRKMLADNRRNMRRLQDQGACSHTPAHAPDAADAVLAELFRQKSRRWRETGSRDLFADPAYRAFYGTLTRDELAGGLVSLCSLRAGRALVATHWGLAFRGRYYWILPGYTGGELARYSPGRLLLQAQIEWAIGQGFEVFDLTVGEEAYKKAWAGDSLPLYRWRQARTFKGHLFLCAGRLKEAARNIRWLRRGIRRLRQLRRFKQIEQIEQLRHIQRPGGPHD